MKNINSKKKKNFFTYGFPRTFYGLNIPIPMQTTYLRDYAQRNKLDFSLPVTEICSKGSYYFLSNIFNEMNEGDNFGAVSILVLPLFDKVLIMELMGLIKSEHTTFHFPLEGFVGNKEKIIKWKDDFELFDLYRSNFRKIPII